MKTIVYIHGTGDRDPSFSDTCKLINKKLSEHIGSNNFRLVPCNWGDNAGARLGLSGKTVPSINHEGFEYDTDANIDIWHELYQDPYFELKLLIVSKHTGGNRPLGQASPGDELISLFKNLSEDPLTWLTPDTQSQNAVMAAIREVYNSDVYRRLRGSIESNITETRFALARAILAVYLTKDQNVVEFLSATERDQLIDELVNYLGGKDKGIGEWLICQYISLGATIGTPLFQINRQKYTDEYIRYVGDILLYQTHPEKIREFVQRTINEASKESDGDVVILAHSLGGIIAFDALITDPDLAADYLITVGSQVPLLFELGALTSLNTQSSDRYHLPTSFAKKWLNIYDLRDFLSYLAQPAFIGNVEDVCVDNKQPFPQSHLSYWNNHQVWDHVKSIVGK
jgi:hypothetical protein